MEEAEGDAVALAHFVDRPEARIAHPRLHLPEQGALVFADHAQQVQQAHAGAHPRPAAVAVLVGEEIIVEAAQRRRLQRQLGRAMAAEPFGEVVVVDGHEAVLVDAVGDHAAGRGETEVGEHEQPARFVVLGDRALGGVRQPARERVEQDEDQRVVAGAQRRRAGAGGAAHFRVHALEDVGRCWRRGSSEACAAAEDRGEMHEMMALADRVGERLQHARVRECEHRRLDPADQHLDVFPDTRQARALSGHAVVGGGRHRPGHEPAVHLLLPGDVRVRPERLVPGAQRRALWAAESTVAVLHEAERVVVEAAPDVQAVLLDTVRDGGIAPARTLAAEPPADLVDSDVQRRAQLSGRREVVGSAHGAGAAAEDRDLLLRRLRFVHFSPPTIGIAMPDSAAAASIPAITAASTQPALIEVRTQSPARYTLSKPDSRPCRRNFEVPGSDST